MKTQSYETTFPAVKVGTSRQVVIPKKIHDALGLSPGDYLSVEVDLGKGRVVFTPKTLVDKPLDPGLAEGLEDFRYGRTHGPFNSAEEAIKFLHAGVKRQKVKKSS